jgi:hypothetical protein
MSNSPKHATGRHSSNTHSPKRTRYPDGHRVVCSVVNGVYYADAVAVDGFLHELAQPPPAQPVLVTDTEDEIPGQETITGEVYRYSDVDDDDDDGAKPVPSTAADPARSVADHATDGMRFSSKSVLGLPHGARVQDSSIGGVKLKDAVVIDGGFVETASLPQAGAKYASGDRVYVRESTIDAENLLLGDWPPGRIIQNAIIMGKDNRIYGSMDDSSVVGCGNMLHENVRGSKVAGDRNTFFVAMQNCQVKGSNNMVNAGMVNSRVEGVHNSFAKGIQDSRIKGNKNKFGGLVQRCQLTGDENKFGGDVVGCCMETSGSSIGGR